jgi:hypothetical protein
MVPGPYAPSVVPEPHGQSVVPEPHGQLVVPGPTGQSVVPEPHEKAMVPGPAIWTIRGSRTTWVISGYRATWAISGSRATWESNGSRTNQRRPTGAIIVGFSMAFLHQQPVVLCRPNGVPMVPDRQDKISFKESDRQRTINNSARPKKLEIKRNPEMCLRFV